MEAIIGIRRWAVGCTHDPELVVGATKEVGILPKVPGEFIEGDSEGLRRVSPVPQGAAGYPL